MNIKYFSALTIFLLTYFLYPVFDASEFNQNNIHVQYKTTALSAAGITALGYLVYHYATTPTQPEITVINLSEKKFNFPKNFAWGIATASTQNEEDSLNNGWSTSYLQSKNKSDIPSPHAACKSWQAWQDDIEKVAHLGVNSYRLSIEWSRVQPTIDTFDQTAIDHYIEICKALRAKNIAPMICLHHYSDPIWFLQAQGFAQEKNIQLFIQFCTKMHQALRPYVQDWIIISQPAAYAIKGYGQAMQPPFIQNMNLSEQVMLNLFKAHIAVYDAFHQEYNRTHIGYQPNIGLCHQITQMQPYTQYNPFDHLIATFADRTYNKALLRFFTTGHFRGLKPLIDLAYIPQAPKKFDFFALSYYCPKSFNGTSAITPKAAITHQTADISRIIDKQGMYDAVVQASQLGKPVYVVESGIDPIDDNQRILLLNSYLSAIAQAIDDGYDIRGYYHWTLMDNYEWSKPRDSSHFGLYKNRVINDAGDLHPDYKNHDIMLKESGKYYKKLIERQIVTDNA